MKETRRLPLHGTCNTRELGGWACTGSTTNWHAFLRSDGPQALTEEDIALLHQYGLTDAVDLRSGHEAAAQPSKLATAEGINSHTVPMLDNIMSGAGPDAMPPTLGDLYIALLDHGGEDFALVFRIFANAKGTVLFHCAVGKDRTGVTAMLLLELAGVSDEDIIVDYASTEIYLQSYIAARADEFARYGIPVALLKSEPENMRRALDHLHDTYGDAKNYLRHIGLTDQEIEAVHHKIAS